MSNEKKDTVNFLSNVSNRVNKTQKPKSVAAPKKETIEERIYREVNEFGKAHPELQETYPTLDELTKYYMDTYYTVDGDSIVRKESASTEKFLDKLIRK